jgi:histidinol dehydrogenase
VTYQKMDKDSCKTQWRVASRMAELEWLIGHKSAADMRMK